MHLGVAAKADNWGRKAAIALGFSFPISVALDNVLLLLVAIFWLAGGGYKGKLVAIKDNRVAAAALALFALLALGTLWGPGESKDALRYLNKYSDLIFIALLMPFLQQARAREQALNGFMAAMVLTLALSYLIWLGVPMPESILPGRTPDNAYVFKLHITHNLLMAFAAFLFALRAGDATTRRARVVYAVLALLALNNVLFMVHGRTGYLVVAALGAYILFALYRWKGLAATATAVALLGVTGYSVSDSFNGRVSLAVEQFAAWQPGQGAHDKDPIGLRMDFYTNTASIIGTHPLAGVGTGGFATAYDAQIRGTTMVPSNNPHNQYLLITAQVGVIGLALLLILFYSQWRLAAALPTLTERHLARGLLLTIMIGSVFNSLLLDHTEGLFFAWMSAVLFAGLSSQRPRAT